MLVFNQKIVQEINIKTSKGEPVVVKIKTESSEIKASTKNKKSKTVDSVTSGTMETKMHFAQSHIVAQNTTVKKTKK
jgi:uncharacterized protein (DUF39 family)